MKKIYSLLASLALFTTSVGAQTFSDNFDSYTANAFLAQSNSAWKTWTNKPGGSDDVKISSAKAYSGANSVYFSSVVSSGGPADIVLPFGGTELTTGSFTMSMMMFVENQKKGYFNLQEQLVLGQGWSIDVNFDSLGKFNIVNTQSGTLLTGTYAQNTWFKVKLNIDFNTNTWEFFLDDVSKGSFQNSYRKIASMDIYPTFNSSFYVDDVSYTVTPFTLPSINGSVTFIDKVSGKLASQKATPVVEIKNLGTTTITSASIDVVYNGKTLSVDASGLSIPTNGLYSIPMSGYFDMASGNKSVTATLTKVNGSADANANDNIKTIMVNPLVPAIGKAVVAEEATGTWCSWCPRGAVWLRNMDERYPEFFIGIAVHNNDPMENANYDGGIKSYISGYPSLIADRGADIDPSAVEVDFFERIVKPAAGTIRSGATYNATTRELKMSLTTKFNTAVTGNYKLAMVLVEDSVTGSGTGWDQANSYAGGGRGVMGGFEKLGNPVPASQMVYDHVGRVIYPNFNGLSNAYSSTIQANDSFTHNFTVVLDPSWASNRMHIVGLLIEPNGRINNASKTDLNDAITNGYVAGTAVLSVSKINQTNSSVLVYPNPSKDAFRIMLNDASIQNGVVKVYSLDGKLVYEGSVNGNETVIETSQWPVGVYAGFVETESGNMSFKLVKE